MIHRSTFACGLILSAAFAVPLWFDDQGVILTRVSHDEEEAAPAPYP